MQTNLEAFGLSHVPARLHFLRTYNLNVQLDLLNCHFSLLTSFSCILRWVIRIGARNSCWIPVIFHIIQNHTYFTVFKILFRNIALSVSIRNMYTKGSWSCICHLVPSNSSPMRAVPTAARIIIIFILRVLFLRHFSLIYLLLFCKRIKK